MHSSIGSAMRRTALGSFSIVLAALLGGCGSKSDAAASSGAAATAQANYATGRVVGEDGKPISVAGVKFSVGVYGMSDAGEKFTYTPSVAPDGTWKTKLVAGTYNSPTVSIVVPFDGKEFAYDLVPAHAIGDFEAKDGFACDFVWHVTGPKPMYASNADPSNWTHYFGAAATLLLDQYIDGPQTPNFGDEKTKVIFTAEPVGKLIDGTDGKIKTYELAFAPLYHETTPSKLHDLPVGKYKVTGQRVSADGTKTPLRLKVDNGTYGDTAEFSIYTYGGGQAAIGPNISFNVK
jgi:hypothetical protein